MLDQLVDTLQFFLGRYDLKLENPEGLWLLLAIPVFLLIGLFMGEELRWWRKLPIQILRAALVLALTIAYCQPVEVSTSDSPAVVLLADLSDSISAESREEMEQKIRQFWSARGEAATYLVGFDLLPRLLAGPDYRRISLPTGGGTAGIEAGTDLAAALRYTYGLFPPEHDRRVVFFSDGEETRGDLLSEAVRSLDFDIQINAVPVQPNRTLDVRLEGLDVPASVREGDEATVRLKIYASQRTRVRIVLSLDGHRVSSESKRVAKGANELEFPVKMKEHGWHSLAARSFAAGDRYAENNRAAARIFVFDRPRILLVQQQDEENPLRTLIGEQDVNLDCVTPASIPDSIPELAKNDLILLDDLDLAHLPVETMDLLRTYVEDLGGGLLATVGQAGSELADPEDLPIESLLPVAFKQVKKKEDIPAALVFVTDRSSSMARGNKFIILLRAVADTLDRLKDSAQVSVVMFDDFPEVIVPLTEARNRDKIRKVLMAQRMGGGTSIYPALEAAHKQLKKSAAKLKHVILLSDGQSISLLSHYGYVVDKMAQEGITITTVALGLDADQAELKKVAGRSHGRFYFTDSMENVPKIFTAETENITETNVVEQSVRAVPAKLVEALAGVDFNSAPPLKGYAPSEPKPTSEVLLVSSDRSEPILARWRFGLGRVMVMTSDAQGAWNSAWADWPGFAKLWPRLVEDTIRKSPPGDIRLASRVEGDLAEVTVRVPAEKPSDDAEVPKLTVRARGGQPQSLPLTRRGLGLYRTRWRMEGAGPFALRAQRKGPQGALETAYGSVDRGFAEEYLSAGGNRPLLQQAVERTGGQLDPAPTDVFAPGRQQREETTEHWPLFALIAMGLFLVEVLLRRL